MCDLLPVAVNMCINCSFFSICVTKGSCVPSLPGRPRIVKVNSTSVSLTWMQPDNDGGTDITGYVIAYVTAYDSVAQHATVGVSTAATVKEMFKCGRSYVFAVAAKNAVGCGDFSHFSEHVEIPKMTSNYLFSYLVNFVSIYVQINLSLFMSKISLKWRLRRVLRLRYFKADTLVSY